MKDQRMVRLACATYRALLIFYPAAHRREYGREMSQLFRDQCRAASRKGGGIRVVGHCARTLVDFVFSATREHAENQLNQMKNITPSRASLILIIAAIFLQQLSVALAYHGRPLVDLVIWTSTLALVLRGICEVKRPSSEWGRGLLWALGISVAYSLICPAWKHTADLIGLPVMTMAAVKAHLFAFGINVLVAVVKAPIALLRRPSA